MKKTAYPPGRRLGALAVITCLLPLLTATQPACQSDAADISKGPANVEPDAAGLGGDAGADVSTRFVPESWQPGAQDAGTKPDSQVTPGPEVDTGHAPEPSPCRGNGRAAGCPCEAPEECASDYCVATDSGMTCVDTCIDSCPAGHACLPIQVPPDIVFLCLPRFAKLCQPCGEHAECQARGDQGVALCVDYGDAGSFCGAPCKGGGECPEGYACEARTMPDGSVSSQCLKLEGECECNTVGSTIGMVTECSQTNEHGSCKGRRSCGPGWLGECDAVTPAAEVCDGADNDCDGEVDNLPEAGPCFIESPYGVCEGEPACTNGKPICVGRTPQPEICNGVDDDCDGSVDEATCDDGLACTADSCDTTAEACVFQPIHEACDDGNPCTADSCDSSSGCVHEDVVGLSCDDGNACTVSDSCVQGRCQGTPIPRCCATESDCDDSNPCTEDSCDLDSGTCEHDLASLEGAPCDADGDGCTVGDVCTGGTCRAGLQADCGESPFDCRRPECVADGPDAHRCELEPLIAGHACSDGDVCTVSDGCDGEGSCRGGEEVPGCCREDADCDDARGCTADMCEKDSGRCVHLPAADGSPCDADGTGCTQGDSCEGGACRPGTLVECASTGPCSRGECVSRAWDSHECVQRPAPEGTVCSDGDPCTAGDSCDGRGACGAGAPAAACCYAQEDCDDGNPCTADACDLSTGRCAYVDLQDGTPCDADGSGCTAGDACVSGICSAGQPACPTGGSACRRVGCVDEEDGGYRCVDELLPKHTICDEALPCSEPGTCNEEGECIPGPEIDCEAEAGGPCLTGYCDPLEGGCVVIRRPDGAACEDGDACTQHDSCLAGTCRSGVEACIEERINREPGAQLPPAVASLGLGRYLTQWLNARASVHSAFRWTADDGSRENEELGLSTHEGHHWSTRIAVDGAGNALVVQREHHGFAARLFDPAGAEIYRTRTSALPVKDGRELRGDHLGRIVPLAFEDGTWGLVFNVGREGATFAPDYLRMVGDLENRDWAVLDGIGRWPQQLDAFVAPDRADHFWIVNGEATEPGLSILRARRYASDGSAIAGGAVTMKTANVKWVRAAPFSEGFVVVWHEVATEGEEDEEVETHHLHAGVYDEQGAPLFDVGNLSDDRQGKHTNPDVATFEDGSFVVVYTHEGQASLRKDVWAMLVDRVGGESADSPLRWEAAEPFLVNSVVEGDQLNPTVAVLDDDDFVVAFVSDEQHAFTRRFHRDGSRCTGRIEMAGNSTVAGDQVAPSAGVAGNGNVLVAYSSALFAGGDKEVLGRLFDPDGAELRPEARLHPMHPANQVTPSVAGHAEGFVVAWDEHSHPDDSNALKARRLDSSGEPVGDVLLLDDQSSGILRKPSVAARPNGSFAVGWQNEEGGRATGLRYRTYYAGGQPQSDMISIAGTSIARHSAAVAAHPSKPNYTLVGIDSSGGHIVKVLLFDQDGTELVSAAAISSGPNNVQPTVAMSADDRVAVCWRNQPEAGADVKCRLLALQGLTPLAPEFRANTNMAGVQETNPRVGWLRDGRPVVGYSAANVDREGFAVQIRAFDSFGFPTDPRRTANRTTAGNQMLGFLLPVSTNRVWVGWEGPEPGGEDGGVRVRVLQRF